MFQGLIVRARRVPLRNYVPMVSKLNKVAGGMNKALFPAETPSAIHLRYSGIISWRRGTGEGTEWKKARNRVARRFHESPRIC